MNRETGLSQTMHTMCTPSSKTLADTRNPAAPMSSGLSETDFPHRLFHQAAQITGSRSSTTAVTDRVTIELCTELIS